MPIATHLDYSAQGVSLPGVRRILLTSNWFRATKNKRRI